MRESSLSWGVSPREYTTLPGTNHLVAVTLYDRPINFENFDMKEIGYVICEHGFFPFRKRFDGQRMTVGGVHEENFRHWMEKTRLGGVKFCVW